MDRTEMLAAFFLDHRDEWIPRHRLGALIGHGSVTQRISDLRKQGFVIEPDKRWIKRLKAYQTFYRYVPHRRSRYVPKANEAAA
jgi:biotin operon repressor